MIPQRVSGVYLGLGVFRRRDLRPCARGRWLGLLRMTLSEGWVEFAGW